MSITVNQASKDEIIKRLKKMPKTFQRSAMSSALNAGAKVIRDKAKANAPACIASTIKTVRRKKTGGAVKVSVIAGNNRSWQKKDLIDSNINAYKRGSTTKRAKKFFSELTCYPAFWVEFGTYGERNLATAPYTSETLAKKRDYWGYKTKQSYAQHNNKSPSSYWKSKQEWIEAKPFMRPAIADTKAIENAMAKKMTEYMNKRGF